MLSTDPDAAEIAWEEIRSAIGLAHGLTLLALMREAGGDVREVRLHHGAPRPLPRLIAPGGAAEAVARLAPPRGQDIEVWLVATEDLRESLGFAPEAMATALAAITDGALAAGLVDVE